MTGTEMITFLEFLARRAEDDAQACAAAAATHRPEYELALADPPSADNHERALELYPFVVVQEQDADNWRQEAVKLREVAEKMRELIP
jgi:hypothetical protein